MPDGPGEAEPAALGTRTDRLLAVYALLTGAALAFPHRPRAWLALALMHGIAAAIGFAAPPAARAWQAFRRSMPALASGLHDGYPLLLVPLLYTELPLLNRSVWDGRYFDSLVIGWEQAIFRMQPSTSLAEALPFPFLSELLHLSYLSYYLLIFGPPLALFVTGRRPELRNAVFALTLVFVVHYLFFVWFPVQGPRYLFPPPGGALAEGPVYRLTHILLEAGSSQGAAFPSSHVGVAVAQTLVVHRYLPRWTPAVALLAAGLAIGTVYGGFHYATDALAGAALGAACTTCALRAGASSARSGRGASGRTAASTGYSSGESRHRGGGRP